MNTTQYIDHEFEVLENIHKSENWEKAPVKQRELAKIAGISLGMTNAILKRLVEKGWLTMRRINSRNLLYAVSPECLEEISKRSYRYLRRTIKNVVHYNEAISSIVSTL